MQQDVFRSKNSKRNNDIIKKYSMLIEMLTEMFDLIVIFESEHRSMCNLIFFEIFEQLDNAVPSVNFTGIIMFYIMVSNHALLQDCFTHLNKFFISPFLCLELFINIISLIDSASFLESCINIVLQKKLEN